MGRARVSTIGQLLEEWEHSVNMGLDKNSVRGHHGEGWADFGTRKWPMGLGSGNWQGHSLPGILGTLNEKLATQFVKEA